MGIHNTPQTRRFMLAAPTNAIYVWCDPLLLYPAFLAHHIGRSDLQIVDPTWVTLENALHCKAAIVADPLTILRDYEWSVLFGKAFAGGANGGVVAAMQRYAQLPDEDKRTYQLWISGRTGPDDLDGVIARYHLMNQSERVAYTQHLLESIGTENE